MNIKPSVKILVRTYFSGESMCKMDKCLNLNKPLGNIIATNDSVLKEILSIISKKERNIIDGVNFYDTQHSSGKHFVLDYRTNVLLSMSRDNYTKKLLDVEQQKNQSKIYSIRRLNVLVIRRSFKAQVQPLEFLQSVFSNVRTIISTVRTGTQFIKEQEFWNIILDFLNLILRIRDGYITSTMILNTLLSLYTMTQRILSRFRPQSLESNSYEMITILLSIIGVPSSVSSILKEYSMITGRRLFSSSFVFDLLSALYTLFKSFMLWMKDTLNLPLAMYTMVDGVLSFVFGNILCYGKIKKVVDLYTKYTSSPEVILRPEFRNEILTLNDELKEDIMFLDYVHNHDNKFFREIWNLFKENLVRYVNTFTTSAKQEPVCIIFEGLPGSGKSVIMNNFVQYLKAQNRSVYVHSVPPTEGGKDFYDDYENQEVFVMDDVGQQGKSQWRTIINFVSPVKYPLECASANKKNTKFFNSKLILCTTNSFMGLNAFTSTDCISEPEALYRRCHVIRVARSVIRQGDDKFLQDISYHKFDHINNHRWANDFLFHNSNIDLPTNIFRQPMISVLTYIRMLVNKIEINEENNRNVTQLSQADLDAINVDINNFTPQFDGFSKLTGFLSKLHGDWKSLFNGNNIFSEWFTGLLKPCKELITIVSNYLMQFFTGVGKLSHIRKIFTANTPQEMLGGSTEYRKNFRSYALIYHPDKYVDGCGFTQQEGASAFVRLTLAHRYYDDIPQFNQQLVNANFDPNILRRIYEYGSDELGLRHRDYLKSRYNCFKTSLAGVFNSMDTSVWIMIATFVLYFGALIYAISQDEGMSSSINDPLSNINSFKHKIKKEVELSNKSNIFYPQVACDVTISKFCKFVVIKSDNSPPVLTHAIVSGNRLLLNSHIVLVNPIASVYSTFEHYENNHPEIELIGIKLVHDYPTCDLTVYQFINMHSVYPSCTPLFRTRNVTPVMYLCTSVDKVPLIFDKNIFYNDSSVEYSMYNKKFVHNENSGFITPVEGEGLCGSFIYNSMGDILAIHAAGDGKRGFCAIPSKEMSELIRDDMLSVRNMQLEVSNALTPNFSGARLVYPAGSLDTSYPSARTTIRESALHVNNCSEMENFINSVRLDSSDLVYTEIDKRGPPIVEKPVEVLKETSMKTFKNQGFVTTEERKFIKDCIRSLMPKSDYYDITDEEAAFGNSSFAGMNKDSSNGYGHPKGKDSYFDFEKKKISPEFLEEFESFLGRIRSGNYVYKDFLSKECFKIDELRNENKRTKPRTIRVLPITHIWLTKKIFGNLAQHFKKYKHETGIGLGFNPFIDFDLLYKKLSDPNITVTGDLDAAKWDGSLVGLMMEDIMEVMFEKYKGIFQDTKEFLITSIVRSFVLVNDELYTTTHGLPSGVWITFLLNSLFNRALDALVVFRNVPKPTVSDFSRIVSYVTGDDKIFGVPKEYAAYVNLISYRDVSLSLGMEATNGDKSHIDKPTQSLDKMTYLKRHMRYHPVLNRYVGPLSVNTILNMPQWVDTTKDTHEAMSGKLRSSQIEAYLHSPSFFKKLTSVYTSVLGSQYLFFNEQQVIDILNRDNGFDYALELRGAYNYSNI
jgi:hypothetical protein